MNMPSLIVAGLIIFFSSTCFGMGEIPTTEIQSSKVITYEVNPLYLLKESCLPIETAPINPFIAEKASINTFGGVYVFSSKSKNINCGDIIVSIAGDPIISKRDYAITIYNHKIGQILSMEVFRNCQICTLEEEVASSERSKIVEISENGELYHLPGSEHLYGETVEYVSLLFAELKYKNPCKICFPPSTDMSQQDIEIAASGWSYVARNYIFMSKSELIGVQDKINRLIKAETNIAEVAKTNKVPSLYVLKSDDYNAFIINDGSIFITKGLFDVLESEDEMAALIAHELSHKAEGHILKAYENVKNTKLGFDIIALIIAASQTSNTDTQQEIKRKAAIADLGSTLFTSLFTTGYSRELEKEADISAIGYMTIAGYDTNGMIRLMKKLSTLEKQHPNYTLFKTHPTPSERIELILSKLDSWKKNGWIL